MRPQFLRQRAALAIATLFSATCLMATPVLAHGGSYNGAHGGGGRVIVAPSFGGGWGWGNSWGWGSPYSNWQPPYEVNLPNPPAPPQPQLDREGWLKECRHRLGDNAVGGAVIGGVIGGLAGNVIAGHGDKVLGTVAGAAVGAVAGAAIDQAEDKARLRDRCEAMLEGGPAYGASYGGAYGYAPYGTMMVPVMLVPIPGQAGAKPPCKETVITEEYVTEPTRRSRSIPPRAMRAPDKRVKLVPDKRIQIQ